MRILFGTPSVWLACVQTPLLSVKIGEGAFSSPISTEGRSALYTGYGLAESTLNLLEDLSLYSTILVSDRTTGVLSIDYFAAPLS